MAFDLDVSPTFAATVQITVPGKTSRPLRLTFHHMDSDVLDDFMKTAHTRTNTENAKLMVASVEDRPQDVESDEAFLARLFKKFPASPRDLFDSYIRELTESRTKN